MLCFSVVERQSFRNVSHGETSFGEKLTSSPRIFLNFVEKHHSFMYNPNDLFNP